MAEVGIKKCFSRLIQVNRKRRIYTKTITSSFSWSEIQHENPERVLAPALNIIAIVQEHVSAFLFFHIYIYGGCLFDSFFLDKTTEYEYGRFTPTISLSVPHVHLQRMMSFCRVCLLKPHNEVVVDLKSRPVQCDLIAES